MCGEEVREEEHVTELAESIGGGEEREALWRKNRGNTLLKASVEKRCGKRRTLAQKIQH